MGRVDNHQHLSAGIQANRMSGPNPNVDLFCAYSLPLTSFAQERALHCILMVAQVIHRWSYVVKTGISSLHYKSQSCVQY
jgi:hypothetical protein